MMRGHFPDLAPEIIVETIAEKRDAPIAGRAAREPPKWTVNSLIPRRQRSR
jgi:hypothetical protein